MPQIKVKDDSTLFYGYCIIYQSARASTTFDGIIKRRDKTIEKAAVASTMLK